MTSTPLRPGAPDYLVLYLTRAQPSASLRTVRRSRGREIILMAREAATPTAACSWSVAPSGLAASFLLLADARSPQLPPRLAQLPLELARPRRLGPQ